MNRKTAITITSILVIFAIIPLSYGKLQERSVIQEIKIEGNLQISTETISYYIASKPGDVYNQEVLLTDFKSLWATGFFDDLRITIDDGETGKIVTFIVKEKKLIQNIEYKGNKSLKKSDIESKLDELDITIKSGNYLDMHKVYRICKAIRDLLDEKGLKFAQVTPEVEPVSSTTANVIVNIDEGNKAKIAKIIFEGNKVMSDWQLLNAMKDTRPHWFFSFLSGHDVYKEDKFMGEEGDLTKIKELYTEKGYMSLNIGDPEIEVKRKETPSGKSGKPKIYITIPIDEGPQYRVGEISCEGNKLFKGELIKAVVGLRKGEIWNNSKLKEGIKLLNEAYANRGFIMVYVAPQFKFNHKEKVIDLDLKVEENDVYRIGRVEFSGNHATKDKVIRRQMMIHEGDVFSFQRVKTSLELVKQLGYFDNIEPEQKINQEEKTVDFDINLHETGRNSIQFGGGYSALEGIFTNFAFETRNFLGRGQKFTVAGQLGRRAQAFSLSFYDPWFLDHHIGLGANVYKRYIRYLDFIQGGTGGGFNFSFPFNRWIYGFLSYNYEVVEIQNPEQDNPLYNLFFLNTTLFPEGKTKISSITSSIVRNTIDHPIMPTKGSRTTLSTEFAGGILGGDFTFIKAKFEQSKHIPLTRRQIFSFRGEIAHAFPLGDKDIPIYERYFLGGEYTIRGVELRSVGPRNENGFIIGGHKYLLLNLEYVFVLSPQLRLAFFHDLGNAYARDEGFNLKDLRRTAGVEFRFFVPFLSVPFRLIWGFNLTPLERESRSNFQFSVGTFF
jgi:outer membrane protein insertion porin family